jgi:hypothetical protein
MMPGVLPNRCFWHVHATNGGVACVFRIGGCGEAMDIASPTEIAPALQRAAPHAVATIDIDVAGAHAAADDARGAARLRESIAELLRTHADDELVFVRVVPPPLSESTPRRGRVAPSAAELRVTPLHRRFGRAVDAFVRRCPELVDRSKRKKRECTNVC